MGADTIEEAWVINNEIIELLQEGGFELDKWTNNPELLKDISKQTSGLSLLIAIRNPTFLALNEITSRTRFVFIAKSRHPIGPPNAT